MIIQWIAWFPPATDFLREFGIWISFIMVMFPRPIRHPCTASGKECDLPLQGILLHSAILSKTWSYFRDSDNEDNAVTEEESHNEDEREIAELKRLEKDMEPHETQEQKDYKSEFFELLDEVLFLLGKTKGSEKEGSKKRRSLRDTSLRFHRRGSANDTLPVRHHEGSSARSSSICVPSMANLIAQGAAAQGGKSSGSSSRKSSWTPGMDAQ